MANTCNRQSCDCAVRIVEFNGDDPAEWAEEVYECARGHQFIEYLEPVKA